jgi:hypothetical protein
MDWQALLKNFGADETPLPNDIGNHRCRLEQMEVRND